VPCTGPCAALKKLIASGAGTGYLPIAPGTWGSAGTCLVFLAVAWGSGGSPIWAAASMAVLAAAASAACVGVGQFAQSHYGRKDPRQCTLDEWAGQALTFILLPLGATWPDRWIVIATAFVAFRLFDIVKPPPGRRLEGLAYGWGVLADDLVAGVYANIASQLFLRLALHMT
jgi:phosphatidylglycerophosphatase A